MSCRFDPHTGIAILNKAYNGFIHLGPPVVPRYKFIGSSSARVTCCEVFITGVKDIGLELFIVRNVQKFIDIEKAIVIGTFPK